jgi:hypothetical protein
VYEVVWALHLSNRLLNLRIASLMHTAQWVLIVKNKLNLNSIQLNESYIPCIYYKCEMYLDLKSSACAAQSFSYTSPFKPTLAYPTTYRKHRLSLQPTLDHYASSLHHSAPRVTSHAPISALLYIPCSARISCIDFEFTTPHSMDLLMEIRQVSDSDLDF